MLEKIGVIGLFCLLWAVGLWLASKNGSKQAQLEAIKEELKKRIKEQERANAVSNTVYNMSIDDVRKRLQDTKHD